MDGRRTLRLHVWGSSSTVPTLDPTSLYASSLLQATFARNDAVKVQLASASTSLSRVPLLQVLNDDDETVELLDSIDSIRTYCVTSGLDSSNLSDEERAKQTAHHALLDDQLLDLTLHSLFSLPANFRIVTAPAYSSVGGVDPPSSSALSKLASLPSRIQPSIPSRLRNVVETRLTAVGLWGLGGKEASAKTGETDELAARAGLPARKRGLGASAKDAARDEFERSKLGRRWSEVLDVVESAIGEGRLGGQQVGTLDAHVFGYLAPLMFAEPRLPVDTLPKLVAASYPRLAAYLTSMKEKLFPETPSWISPTQALAHPPSMEPASSSGFLSYLWPFAPASNKASFAPLPTAEPTTAPSRERQRKPHPPAASPEDKRLRWGRALWICSALVGLVGYTFASGIVSVRFVGPDEVLEEEEGDDDDDEDDEEEEDEEEDEEGGWEVQTEDDMEEDLDDMDMDDDDDDEEEY